MTMQDPYQILGVTKDATAEEIRKAYRSLAKKNHPDLHPGNKTAEARFKEIASAYGIVGDETKRKLFDSGNIDATGATVNRQPDHESYRQHAEARPGFKYERHFGGSGGDDDLFAEFFSQRANSTARGADSNYTFAVEFLDAVNGAKKRVVMADGKTLDIVIPAALKDGQTLRLRGQGQPGYGGGEAGDVLVAIHVKPHPSLKRDGNDIRSILPVTPGEALGGGKVPVGTIAGTVNLTIPKASNSGTILRLRGKGVPSKDRQGDHLVELRIVLPDQPDDDLTRAVVEWEVSHPYDPRAAKETSS
jgi:DnaJ-class molecular chaperone